MKQTIFSRNGNTAGRNSLIHLWIFPTTPLGFTSILANSAAYLKIMCCNLFLVSAYNFVSSMLRALGDSKTPLYFLIFSCFLNIILDLIFVCAFHMGVIGAGIATLISNIICGGLCIIFAFRTNIYFKFSKSDLHLNTEILGKCVKLGVPLSLQYSMIAISCMALQRVVNNFGPVAVAAFTAVSRVEQLLHQPYQTLGAALSTYSGQNFGAKKYDRIHKGIRNCVIISWIWSAFGVAVIYLFGRKLIYLISGTTNSFVIDTANRYIRINIAFFFVLGILLVLRSSLQGLGRKMVPVMGSVVEMLFKFAAVGVVTKWLGYFGVCILEPIIWSVCAIMVSVDFIIFNKSNNKLIKGIDK